MVRDESQSLGYLTFAENRPGYIPLGRIVKAKDFVAVTTAENIIQQANQQAELIKKQAQLEFEAQKAAGYQAGLKLAQDEKVMYLMALENEFNQRIESFEHKLKVIFPQALEYLMQDIGELKVLQEYVAKSIANIVHEKSIVIKVHPNLLNEFENFFEQRWHQDIFKHTRIEPDSSLSAEEAIIETSTTVLILSIQQMRQQMESFSEKILNVSKAE